MAVVEVAADGTIGLAVIIITISVLHIVSTIPTAPHPATGQARHLAPLTGRLL